MLLITHNKHTHGHVHPHFYIQFHQIYLNSGIPAPYGAPEVQDTMELFKENGRRRGFLFLRGRQRSRVVWGVHREVVVAFMVIASQHPIVSGLSGWSNLGVEVVAFCTLADQTIVISSGAGALLHLHAWSLLNSGNR